MLHTHRSWLRTMGAVAGGAALVATGVGSASAHVTVTTDRAAAGSTALLAFSLAHGCAGSSTTKVAIKVPKGINSVAPTVNAGWTVTKVSTKLSTPIQDQHGTTLTERVDQVVYTAKTPLADGYRDVLTVSVPLPEDGAGQVLAFPVVQTCVKGETAWVDLPAEGQDPDELEAPAPAITVSAAEGTDEHGSAGGGAVPKEATETGEAPAAVVSTNRPGLGVAGLVAGLAGLAMGAMALLRGRRPSA